VWSLVERPKQNVMGTKWVFRNKQDEHKVVIRNKAKLVAKGYLLTFLMQLHKRIELSM
jgi:hypothetical protein